MAEVLGTFEQAVLLEVLRLRDEAYGRAILKAVRSASSGSWPRVPFMPHSNGSRAKA